MTSRRTLARSLVPVMPLLALAGCYDGSARSAPVNAVPGARVVGEPVNCLSLTSYRETRIRDDRTIDFIGTGGRVWRNTLPFSCPGLRANDAFSHEATNSQICNVDVIRVLYQGGGPRLGPSCGLGQFVPVELAPAAPR